MTNTLSDQLDQPTVEYTPTPQFKAEDVAGLIGQWSTSLDQAFSIIQNNPTKKDEAANKIGHHSFGIGKLITELTLPEHVPGYYNNYLRENEIKKSLGRYHIEDIFNQTTYNLGAPNMIEAIKKEDLDGPLHQGMLDTFKKASLEKSQVPEHILDVLTSYYDFKSKIELFKLLNDSGRYSDFDKEVKTLLLDVRTLASIRYFDQLEENIDQSTNRSSMPDSIWISKALEYATGLSEDEAKKYAFHSNSTVPDEEFSKILSYFETFGKDRILNLTEKTGIISLGSYTQDQLETMLEYAEKPQDLSEKLKDRDVCVMFINRLGDHNAVLYNIAQRFDNNNNGNYLFFEVSEPMDIYRSISSLNKDNINPSTLVIGAHGSPGSFTIGNYLNLNKIDFKTLTTCGRNAAILSEQDSLDEEPLTEKEIFLSKMRGFKKIIDNYMKPSSGKDDGNEGQKTIIFAACSSASENIAQYGSYDSVAEHIIKDLASQGSKSNIQVFGADDKIQMGRNEKGIIYTIFNGVPPRVHKKATRFSLKDGKVQPPEEVDEIIM
jgi:cell fate (sporulation/competence/biofilm development) regulator YlbF (YheA/YmcA/DUF963 family)